MIYIATHALGIAMLLVLFASTGALVAQAFPAINRAGRRTGLVQIAVGIAVWEYLVFAFAAIGLLRTAVLASAIALTLAAAALLGAGRARPRDDPPGPRDARWPPGAHAAAALPLVVVVALLFIGALSPWVGWDDMVEHLAIPKIYLQHGGFVRIPFNAYSNWPIAVQMLYTLAMAVGDYVLAKLVHLALLALLTVGVYRFAARSAAPWAGVVAAALLLANDVVQVEATTANVDIGVAFFFFMAATLAVEFRETGDRGALVLCGVCCGCVAASKITGLGALICVFPLVVAGTLAHVRTGGVRALAATAVSWVGPALALALPWLIRNALYTGDPLYPVLFRYVGGREWSAELDAQFWRWQQSIGMGRSPHDYLLLPIRVILFGGGDYRHFAAWVSKTWILFAPLAVLATPFITIVRRCLVPAGIYFIIWAFTSQQTRFLIAVLPLFAVSASITLSWLTTAIAARIGERRRRLATGVLAAANVIGAVALLAWATRYTARPAFALARDFVTQAPDLRTWVPNPVYAYIRDRLPASARLMLIDTNQGFFIDRDYIADSFFEASQLRALVEEAHDREGLTALFRRLGVTHVLVKNDEPWVRFADSLWEYLCDPATARRSYTSPDESFTVYELHGPSAGRHSE